MILDFLLGKMNSHRTKSVRPVEFNLDTMTRNSMNLENDKRYMRNGVENGLPRVVGGGAKVLQCRQVGIPRSSYARQVYSEVQGNRTTGLADHLCSQQIELSFIPISGSCPREIAHGPRCVFALSGSIHWSSTSLKPPLTAHYALART